MSTIVTIQSTDLITNSRADINSNFSALNTDKIETSVLDTDTTLAANSDAKIATQKAVKAYVDAGGNVNASTTVKGIVEEATDAEVTAGTATGATGARLFVNPASATSLRTITVAAGATTQDISSTTTNTIAHTLGVVPTLVKITGVTHGTGNSTCWTSAVYVNSTQSSLFLFQDTGSGTEEQTGQAFRFQIAENSDKYLDGTITVDATNISIAWSKTSDPTGTANIMWEAYR